MAAFDVYNGTGSILTDINAGGDDVAAGKRLDNTTLTGTELLALLTTAGVAVVKTGATAAQLNAALDVMLVDANGGASTVAYAAGTYDIVNGTSAALTNVNAGGDDVPAYSIAEAITLLPSELDALGKTAGVILLKSGQTDAVKHKVVKTAKLGTYPSAA